jgi:transposase
MKKRKTRNYDDDFKNNAVSLYLSSGRSYPQLGEELGIAPSTLAGWVNSGKYHKDGSNRRITEAELSELKVLRKELAHVKMERDILKKAMAIFTKPTNGRDSSL